MALLFSGTRIKDFNANESAPEAVTEVNDPLGSNKKVMAFTVHNSDVYPLTPTDNPRAQLLGPNVFPAESERWWKVRLLIPNEFPTIKTWCSLASVYGPPFSGSSPWNLQIATINAGPLSGEYLDIRRDDTYGNDVPWSMRVPRGEWVTFLYREYFAENGWVEMWMNGTQLTFFKPATSYNPNSVAETTKLYTKLIDGSNNQGVNAAKIMQYREKNLFDVATIYHEGLWVGTTRASVEEGSTHMSYPSTVLEDAPIGYWRLGEASGTVATDASTVANNGAYKNNPTLGVSGAVQGDTAITLNGTNQEVSVPNVAAQQYADTFTMECWAKRARTEATESMISKEGGGAVLRFEGNKVGLRRYGIANVVQSTTSITDSLWHHIVCTKAGESVHLYIDGVDVTGTVTNSTFAEATGTLNLGASNAGEAFFQGSLDEVAIYKTALSEARVKVHYAAGIAALAVEAMNGPFLRDKPTGRLVATATIKGMTKIEFGEEWMRSGFVRDKNYRLVVTESLVGAVERNGFLRDPENRLIVTTNATGAVVRGGFLKAPNGALVISSTETGIMRNGFMRDTNYALAMVLV